MKTIEGVLTSPSARIAIIAARFNQFINQSLMTGAIDALTRIGKVDDKNITVIWVPGAYEIPLTAKAVARSGHYDGIVALGTVIRGETVHFDYVAGGSSNGLMSVALECDIPIGFGILTTENLEQAIDRSGIKAGNKGAEAALTVLEMLSVLHTIEGKS